MKNLLNIFFGFIGYKIISNRTYDQFIVRYDKQNKKSNLLQNFYDLLLSLDYSPKVVYDIGANRGNWTEECLNYFPKSTYYLFEPQVNLKPYCSELLKKNKKVKLFSVGVGNTEGSLNFTIVDRDDSCSFRYSTEEATEMGFKQIKVPIIKLDKFIIENDLEPPSILKIDAEGLDLDVLEGAKNTLSKIDILMIEASVLCNVMPNTSMNVINYLDKKGFRLFDITDMNRPFQNKVLWLCEFVFIKKGGLLDKDFSK